MRSRQEKIFQFTIYNFQFLFSIFYILFACTKTKQPDYYPLKTGDKRTYQVLTISYSDADTLKQTKKIVTEVLDVVSHQKRGPVFKIVNRDYGRRIDSVIGYIKKTERAIKFLNNLTDTLAELNQLEFPLGIGREWIVAQSPRETLYAIVIDRIKVQIPFGEFDNCYLIEIRPSRGEFVRRIYLAPEVGIVKNELETSSYEKGKRKEIKEVSELVGYSR